MNKLALLILFSLFYLFLGTNVAFAAPFCVVAGAAQTSDQAFIQLDISLDTPVESVSFPFTIRVDDPITGSILSTNQVSSTNCVITNTQRTCTYRLTGNRALFGVPANNTQPLSLLIGATSQNNAIICQNSLVVPAVGTPLVCGMTYNTTPPVGTTYGICPCNSNSNPSMNNGARFCCGWIDDKLGDACGTEPPNLTPCSSPIFNPQSTEYTTQVPNSQACLSSAGATRYKCRDTYDSTPTACVAKTTCMGTCQGDAAPKQYSNGTQCTGIDGVCYQCVAPTFQRCAQQPPPGAGGGGTAGSTGVTAAMLDTFNSAIFGGAPNAELTTPRGIIGRLIPYLLTFGGLILFIMLVWGGFEMLTGAAEPKAQGAGKQRITAAIIGFILLFSSYWLAQLVQAIFGVSIL